MNHSLNNGISNNMNIINSVGNSSINNYNTNMIRNSNASDTPIQQINYASR